MILMDIIDNRILQLLLLFLLLTVLFLVKFGEIIVVHPLQLK